MSDTVRDDLKPLAERSPPPPTEFSRASSFDIMPRNFQEAKEMAEYLSKCDMVPVDYRGKPGNIIVAMQMGHELGMPLLNALQGISVINGRPALWGDALLGLVRKSPAFEYIEEWEDDAGTAHCRIKRKGEKERIVKYGNADAEMAGLLNKAGPWKTNPKRMKQLRARSFAIRDVFTDVIKGMAIYEEEESVMYEQGKAPPSSARMNGATVERVLDPMTPERFEQMLPTWAGYIKAGQKSGQQIIDFLETKNALTDSQKSRILAVEDNAAEAQ